VIASPEWENLSLAGAFLVGAALAVVAVLRVMRYVTNYFANVADRDMFRGAKKPPPSEDDGGFQSGNGIVDEPDHDRGHDR
jgi:hypothetical protein